MASPIIIPKHNFRDCVFDEAKSVQDAKKETKENVQKMVRFLEEKGFPKHYGLNENSFIYRKHNDPLLIKIMDEWWYFIENYTKRDQLSLAYVLWEHQIIPENISIPNLRSKKDDIHFERHN